MVETQAAFARRIGVDRSHVTRLKQHGRLVMAEDGKRVDVDASLARIEATGGMRFDVAERHAAGRASKNGAGADREGREGGAKASGKQTARGGNREAVGGETRAEAQARKEALAADLLEMELAQKRGNLIPKEDVDAALKTFAAAMRAALEVFPDQVAPLVAPVSNLDEVHAVLAEASRGVLAGVADQLARAEAAMKAEAA